MAVPSSGEIRLSKIAAEKHFDNYNHNQSVASPISLKDVSTSGNSGGSGSGGSGKQNLSIFTRFAMDW